MESQAVRQDEAERLRAELEREKNLTGVAGRAAFFARTYAPSLLPGIVPLWKVNAARHSKRAAEALAEPPSVNPTNADKFPDFEVALQAEVREGREEATRSGGKEAGRRGKEEGEGKKVRGRHRVEDLEDGGNTGGWRGRLGD